MEGLSHRCTCLRWQHCGLRWRHHQAGDPKQKAQWCAVFASCTPTTLLASLLA